jgi:hypothetical protein
MDGFRSLLAGCLDQAEDLAGSLVEPVLQVVDTVLVLALQILAVGVRDTVGGQTVDLVVDIQIQWHPVSSW